MARGTRQTTGGARQPARPARQIQGEPGRAAHGEPRVRSGRSRFRPLRAVFGVLGGATAAALLGCPMYEDHCDDRGDCARGYYCDRFIGRCMPPLRSSECLSPADCGAGETCTPDFVCRPGSCAFHGCVSGHVCSVVDGAHACVASDGDAAPPPSPLDASLPADAGNAVDAAAPDAADASTGGASSDAAAPP
jgi:hypothetical protein